MDVDAWTRELTRPLAARKIIVAFKVLAATTHDVQALSEWGAARPMILARGLGTGPTPDPADARIEMLELPVTSGATMTDDVRQSTRLFTDLPPGVAQLVDDYDPDGQAFWLASPFCPVQSLLGRRVLGGRHIEWIALEDKTLADELFDTAGISRAPAEVVPAQLEACVRTANRIDRGDGTVWSGDTRDGINGGGDYVRWVRTLDQARAAADFFAANCDRVRVMPFLDGIACSIHGFCLPDGVAAFRPVELVVLRDVEAGRFVFGGMSTWWDPPTDARDQMRSAAKAVGAVLADRVGYRGGFSIDGVLTADGFLPTELNPRFSGGLSAISRAIAPIPLDLLQLVVTTGWEPGIDVASLEELVVTGADATRHAGLVGIGLGVGQTETEQVGFAWRDGAFEPVDTVDGADLVVTAGPATFDGAFFRIEPALSVLVPGASVTALHAKALAAVDRRWGSSFGDLAVPQ